MRSSKTLWAALAVPLVLVLLAGCGGGGPVTTAGHPAGTGAVTGGVVFFDVPTAPVTGVEVDATNTVTFAKTVTHTVSSAFSFDLAPGFYTITVIPPDTFTLPQDSVVVLVTEGTTYTIPAPFILLPQGEVPPGGP